MRYQFDPSRSLIVVRARLWGPSGESNALLVLDTGAVYTAISSDIGAFLAYQPVDRTPTVRVVTGSGESAAHQPQLHKMAVLGRERSHFSVLCHPIPRKSRVDGLLGQNFFRGHRLTLDLLAGWVSLE